MSYVLFNGQIVDKQDVELNILSPFLNYSAGIKECMLYKDGEIKFYDFHREKILSAIADLNFNFSEELFDEQSKIIELIKSNGLEDKEVLVKYYCLENFVSCDVLVIVTEYKRYYEPVDVVLHFEPRFGRLYKYNLLSRFDEYYWFEFYTERFEHFELKEILFPNFKGQVIGGFRTNVLAVWNKNLYVVHHKQPYYETVMQERILRDYKKLGFKRIIEKSKGFSLDFLRRVDEVILVNDLMIALPVRRLIRAKSAFSEPSIWDFKFKGFAERIRNFYLG